MSVERKGLDDLERDICTMHGQKQGKAFYHTRFEMKWRLYAALVNVTLRFQSCAHVSRGETMCFRFVVC